MDREFSITFCCCFNIFTLEVFNLQYLSNICGLLSFKWQSFPVSPLSSQVVSQFTLFFVSVLMAIRDRSRVSFNCHINSHPTFLLYLGILSWIVGRIFIQPSICLIAAGPLHDHFSATFCSRNSIFIPISGIPQCVTVCCVRDQLGGRTMLAFTTTPSSFFPVTQQKTQKSHVVRNFLCNSQ